MKIKVTKNEVKINKDILNDGEYNIHKCQFDFDEEYTGLVQKAVFTLNDGTSYLETIVNNECNIPIEVLEEGVLKIGVYAYETNNDELVLRYSPSPDIIHVFDGSYVKDAQNSEGGTPTEYEQLESRVNTALNEIDEALEDVETAVNEANNLDIDVSKTGKVATIDVTKKNGTVKTVTLSDGTSLQFKWEGTKLGIKTENEESYTYVDLQGPIGQTGPQGAPFQIKKTYATIEQMVADYDNMEIGDYVMISGSVEDEDNAKLFVKTETEDPVYKWQYLGDFSGATGIQGPTGATPNIQIGTVTSGSTPSVTRTGTNENPVLNFVLQKGDTGPRGETGATGNGILSIKKTATAGLVDTYTITYTDGTTTTFDVTNGEDGEVTQAQLDETNENVSWLQTLTEQMPHVAGQGTDLSLESVLNYRLMKFLPQGVSKQFSTTGKNKLDFDNLFGNANILTKNADGSYTATGDGTNKGVTVDVNIPAGNYYLSVDYVAKSNVTTSGDGNLLAMNIFYDDNTSSWGALILSTSTVGTRLSFKISETNKSIKRIYLGQFSRFTGGTLTFKNVQIGTDDTYERYTGGIPAPNPSYPYPVNSVTGENSLVIQNENLLPLNNIAQTTKNGVTYSCSNGALKLNGTATSGVMIEFDNVVIPAGTYMFSSSIDNPNGSGSYARYITSSSGSNLKTNGGEITLTGDTSLHFRFYTNSGAVFNNATVIAQLVKGSTAPTTYVEHEEQNYRLSFGNMEFNSSPDGTIRDQIKGSSDVSYNLFDKNNANILSNTYIGSSSIGIANGAKILYYECKPNTTYTVSKIASQRFIIGDTNETPANGVTVNNRTANNTGTDITITTSANAQYLVVFYYLSTADTLTEQEILDSIQITEGSEVKPYFPYGQVGMWYKREYIGKVVLDGSEDENWILNTTNIPFYNISNVFYGSQNLNNTSLCSHFQIRSTITAADTNIGIFGSATGHYFRIRLETMMSLEDFKLWLQAQSQAGTPVTIYYLKTNEDIPITDTILINQLNDIYNNAHSYNGVTNITTTYEDGNEQMYLDIEALKNVWEVTE